jgi:hypothetical protein
MSTWNALIEHIGALIDGDHIDNVESAEYVQLLTDLKQFCETNISMF